MSCMFDQPWLELNANEYTYELTVGIYLMYMFGWKKLFHYNYFFNMKKYINSIFMCEMNYLSIQIALLKHYFQFFLWY